LICTVAEDAGSFFEPILRAHLDGTAVTSSDRTAHRSNQLNTTRVRAQLRQFTVLGFDRTRVGVEAKRGYLGYLRAYEELRDPSYLRIAETLLGYWSEHCADGLFPVGF